jgi:hypothetical protein
MDNLEKKRFRKDFTADFPERQSRNQKEIEQP